MYLRSFVCSLLFLAGCSSTPGTHSGPSATFVLVGAVAVSVELGEHLFPAYSSSYAAGSWSPVTAMAGHEVSLTGGGGVTVLSDGRAVAVFEPDFPWGGRPQMDGFGAVWNAGAWGAAYSMGTVNPPDLMSPPIATPTGALWALDRGTSLGISSFDGARSVWVAGADIGVESLYTAGDAPAIALTGTGSLVLVYGNSNGQYHWAVRTGTTWTTPGLFIGFRHTSDHQGQAAPIVLATRVGVDEVVGGLLVTGVDQNNSATVSVVTERFAMGTWRGIANSIDDLSVAMPAFSMVALPDGRVALGYLATGGMVRVGFYDGAAWGPFQTVPANVFANTATGYPFALARGADAGAVLELVYADAAQHLNHVRLTAEATWSWTPPVTIDATHRWQSVWVAVGP